MPARANINSVKANNTVGQRKIVMRRFILLVFLSPLVALAWQARVWPEIKDASPLATFAKEKTQVREQYLSKDRKLDFAFLPEKEWPEEISAMKPQAVLIERGYLLIALAFDLERMQAIAVVSDTAAFKKDEASWLIEQTSDSRIKRVFTKPKVKEPNQRLEPTPTAVTSAADAAAAPAVGAAHH
ncbi:MAG: hypothetical protein QM760_11395 [Nibricoccus sp.]